MGSTLGRYFRVTTFGESHGPALGAVVEGLPAGVVIDRKSIQTRLDRRKPGTSDLVSLRKEPDRVEILSGVARGQSLGTPITLLIRNQNQRSGDYDEISQMFRPGHSDYTYFYKYGVPPQPGGGRASGRETAARAAAGALAEAFLDPLGVSVSALVTRIGEVKAQRIEPGFAKTHPLCFADPDRAKEAQELVRRVRDEGDSIGGMIRISAQGVPPGLGSPVFDKLEASLGAALLSIGAVKGIEFGAGFALAEMRGSEANDPLVPEGEAPEGFSKNDAGGILGGISSGQEIVINLAVKPTPSIARPQATIDLEGNPTEIQVRGRHDPCLCPRICPVAEAMVWLVLADAHLEQTAQKGATS